MELSDHILTEGKPAEEDNRAYLKFLESMDRIHRAVQGTNDLERMMSDVLDAVLEIFACDRAWLVYPCDPDAASWRAVMEHTRPEFPGAFALGTDLPLDAEVAVAFRTARASQGAVLFGPAHERKLPADAAERFRIRSQMAMTLYPKGDQPYLFGLHQCSHPRCWTAQEQRLFEEIGHRLADALTSLLMFRSLRESERRLDEAQRMAHVGYWDRDLDAGSITLSDESCRIFGFPPDECVVDLTQWHEHWLALIHPEDRPKVTAAAAAALRGGPRYDVEYRVVHPGGDVRIVHSRGDVTWDESGRPRRMFGMLQDITELRQTEAELRASEDRFRTFVDPATDAFFLIGEQSKVVDVNRQASESLGYTREELIGMTPYDFDPHTDIALLRWVGEQLAAGADCAFETWHRRKDGTLFPVEVRIRPFWHDGHRLSLSLARDISERKRAEEALQKVQAELAHITRVTTMGELTSSIAHEVNQPLAAIVTNGSACLRWLAGPAPDLEEARQAVERIIKEGNRAAEVIGRIRALVKKTPPQKEQLDLNETLLEVIALARGEVQRNRVSLQTHLSDDMPPVLADRIQLQQVLLNLIMNGIEAMSTVQEGPRELRIRSQTDGSNGVLVTVEDTGVGLDEAHFDRLFDAFYTTKPQGLGMGLAISRSIIQAHGGRLWATPNAPRGAVLQFTLPVAGGSVP